MTAIRWIMCEEILWDRRIQFTAESPMIIFFQPNSSGELWESFQMRQMSQSIKYDKVPK